MSIEWSKNPISLPHFDLKSGTIDNIDTKNTTTHCVFEKTVLE